MGTRARLSALICVTALGVLSGCGQGVAPERPGPASSGQLTSGQLPRGVMSAAAACRHVVKRASPGFFTHPERVHLVLTTYAQGEPVESGGDISSGMPPRTLVWVIEIHAKAIHSVQSYPPGYQGPARPYTDYSEVMNARTGEVTDGGSCNCWPLPLWKVGTVVSLPPEC
jgi:hypothetical protein